MRPKFEWSSSAADNDPYDVAKEAGINILSNKEFVGGYVVDDQWVAVLFEAADYDGYEFDVAVSPGWQRKGLGSDLTDMAIEHFYDYQDAYGPDFTFNIDVVNKHMVRMLKRRGFEVVDKQGGHTMMTREAASYWYHGSPEEFDQFETKDRHTFGDGPSKTPLFFSPSEKFAKMYAGRSGTIYKAKLKWRKIFDSDNLIKSTRYWPPTREEMTAEGQKLYDDLDDGKIFGRMSDGDWDDSNGLFAQILRHDYDVIEDSAFKRWMKKNGYDAFYVRGDGETNVGVFKPSQVEIVDSYPVSGRTAASDQSILRLIARSGIVQSLDSKGVSSVKRTPMPKRDKKYGVGKKMPDATYVHRMYEDVFPQDELDAAKELLPPGFDYDIVKYAGNGNFGFSESPDFDRSEEPTQGVSYSVRNGKAKKISPSTDPWIYHHKWLFVEDNYPGFDVEDSKERSRQWLIAVRDMKTTDPRIFSRIGKKSFWDAIEVDSLVDTQAVALSDPLPLPGKQDGAYMETAYGTRRFVVVVKDDSMYTALKKNTDPVTGVGIERMNPAGIKKAFRELKRQTRGLTRP